VDEKRYEIKLPDNAGMSYATCTVQITKSGARSLREQLDKIEAEPKARVWRDGDFLLPNSQHSIYIAGSMYWLNGDGKSAHGPSHFDQYPLLGNLADLLAQGPILVGLTEELAGSISEINYREPIPRGASVLQQIVDALVVYQQRKGK
jgi:hypothetical protein